MFSKRRGLQVTPKRYVLFSLAALFVLVCIAVFVGARYFKVVHNAITPDKTEQTKKQAASGSGRDYYVAPAGSDKNSGAEAAMPFASIQKALDLAQPGDTVRLADGNYYQSITSVRAGTEEQPITITGSHNAVLLGGTSRIIEIRHSHLVLNGFQVNGHWASGETKASYRDKLIYVIGSEEKRGAEGLKLTNLLVQNAGGECVRLRYFAKNNEISYSTIKNCGVYDFRFSDGGKNGEGIYIGTAPEQRRDGKNPTADPDESSNNHVHHNYIETNGNECVDVKESAHGNLVEHNTCTGQRDPESGGMDSRGDGNTFRYNLIENTLGAAVRLGGDGPTDGIDNNVYGNTFRSNRAGALNIQRTQQGKICGNTLDDETRSHRDGLPSMASRVCDQ